MQWTDCENITLICLVLSNDELYRNFLNTSSLEHFPNLKESEQEMNLENIAMITEVVSMVYSSQTCSWIYSQWKYNVI